MSEQCRYILRERIRKEFGYLTNLWFQVEQSLPVVALRVPASTQIRFLSSSSS